MLFIPPAKEEAWLKRLHDQRIIPGSVLASMEVWLGLRSLRSFGLRVQMESENATDLVKR